MGVISNSLRRVRPKSDSYGKVDAATSVREMGPVRVSPEPTKRGRTLTSLPPSSGSRWNAPAPPVEAGQPPQKRSSPPFWLIGFWIAAVAMFVIALVVIPPSHNTNPEVISYSTMLAKVSQNSVKSVQVNQSSGVIDGAFTDGKAFTTQGPPNGLPGVDVALLNEHHVARNYAPTSSSIWPTILTWGFFIGVLVLIWAWIGRRTRSQMAGISGWGKSGAKVHSTDKPSTTFADVAGYENVKQEVAELVQFLKEPERFREIGARIPKGVLLVGPPGTGKTLIARAVAGEAGVPFITISGSEFMEMFVGIGAARVRDLFRTARADKPSIIFIDEIDAIGRKRGTGLGGGHDEREQTLNQILSEMDGFDAAEGIVVMAATNRPDILDPALLRAGRFDRQVVVPLPTYKERLAILRVHGRGLQLGPDADLDAVAKSTPGMSGADLENLMNEAALTAVRRGHSAVAKAELEAAVDRVLLGLERSSVVLGPDEKRIVAHHEAGHALLAYLLPHADPVHKVTILPIGMALGATQQLPEERQLQQQPYLEDALAVRLGGRAAEELIFGVPSTGAQDDLTGATELAIRMVREWGMSEAIGGMAWGQSGPVFLGQDLIHTREYSDETARLIDQEAARILDEQAKRAKHVLSEHRAALEALAQALMVSESLDGDDVERIATDTATGTRVLGAQPAGLTA